MGQRDLPLCDAAMVAKVLGKFGYSVAPGRGKGSHVVMVKAGANTVTIPRHSPVKRGTLAAILLAAGITVDEFRDAHRRPKGKRA